MQTPKYDDKFNIMIIGDEKVGKTSILERYSQKKFISDRRPTLGVERYEKTKTIGDKDLLIKFWDTAGQEKFAAMARSYYKRAHGIILACSLTNKNSFSNMETWLSSIKDNCSEANIQLIIMANKCDLENEREVTSEELEIMSNTLNIEAFECSAKDNINIDKAFDSLIEKVFNNSYMEKRINIEDERMMSVSGKKCC